MVKIIRSVLAVIGGYAVIVLAAALAQDALYGGVSYTGSSFSTLAIAGTLTAAGTVLAGAALASIAGRGANLHGAVLAAWLVFETTFLAATGVTDNPIWLDVLTGGSLIAALFLGVHIYKSRSGRRQTA